MFRNCDWKKVLLFVYLFLMTCDLFFKVYYFSIDVNRFSIVYVLNYRPSYCIGFLVFRCCSFVRCCTVDGLLSKVDFITRFMPTKTRMGSRQAAEGGLALQGCHQGRCSLGLRIQSEVENRRSGCSLRLLRNSFGYRASLYASKMRNTLWESLGLH